MSSLVLSDSSQSSGIVIGANTKVLASSGSGDEPNPGVLRISHHGNVHITNRQREPKQFDVVRRLKGFISDTAGETWTVVFVVDGKEIEYDMPADRLRNAGISEIHQPFEMDEMVPNSPDYSGKIYRFRALASKDDAFIQTISFDEETTKKRDLILKRFGSSEI